VKVAVLHRIGDRLSIVDLKVPEPEAGQVLVRILCAGICGSQLQEIDGIKGDRSHLPHLLGHEGFGIIEKIGKGVTHINHGDKCVLHWRKGAGMDVPQAFYGMWLPDVPLRGGPITTFSEYSTVSENRVTKIDDDVPNDLACLLGCALSTALAIVENEAKPTSNESVCVIGCGGVGLALILAARLKTNRVYGTDRNKSKLSNVRELGAVFQNKAASDIIIDTVGTFYPSFIHKYISLQPGGTSAGGFQPDEDIPRYVQMWRDGLLNDYPKLITHRIKLDQINEGIQLMRDGKAGRVLIEME